MINGDYSGSQLFRSQIGSEYGTLGQLSENRNCPNKEICYIPSSGPPIHQTNSMDPKIQHKKINMHFVVPPKGESSELTDDATSLDWVCFFGPLSFFDCASRFKRISESVAEEEAGEVEERSGEVEESGFAICSCFMRACEGFFFTGASISLFNRALFDSGTIKSASGPLMRRVQTRVKRYGRWARSFIFALKIR